MGLFDALVQHFHQNVVVVVEFHHQLLRVLHRFERVIVHKMGVVEEQIVFRSQLYFYFFEGVAFALDEHLCSDGF